MVPSESFRDPGHPRGETVNNSPCRQSWTSWQNRVCGPAWLLIYLSDAPDRPPPWLMASSHAPIRAIGSWACSRWSVAINWRPCYGPRHRHPAPPHRAAMGENTLRARASDRLDLEAGSLAGSGSPLPWLACLGTG